MTNIPLQTSGSFSRNTQYFPEALLSGKPNILTSLQLKEMFANRVAGALVLTKYSGEIPKNSTKGKDSPEINTTPLPSVIKSRIERNELMIEDISGTEQEVRKEFSRLIGGKNIQTIRFLPGLDTAKKRLLSNILTKNHPLIEVLRLIPGNDLVNISFAGIKRLNDLYGQDFVDQLLARSKRKIMQHITEYTRTQNKSNHVRLVRDDYKNLTVSVPPDARVQQILFGNISTKKQFIYDIIHDMNSVIALQSEKKDVNPATITDNIQKYFNFGIGKSHVGKTVRDKDKLRVFAEAEGVSRDGLQGSEITVQEFDKKRYAEYAEKFLKWEEKIMTEWHEKKFQIGGMEDSVIIHVGGQDFLNPELLRQVRKHGGLGSGIEPKDLAISVEQYISTLNKGFDFIVPALNLEQDLETANNINQDFSNGIMSTASVLETFKGVMTHEHFLHMVGKQNGMRVFVDIKDMGIENLQSFRQLAKKVGSGTYTGDDLLSAGKEMTDKFTLFVKQIRESYPDALISLGGDEIRLFFPVTGKVESTDILTALEKNLQQVGLEGRSSHTLEVVQETEDSEKIFKKLDESTILHKLIEAALLRKRALLEKNNRIQEIVSLELGSGVTEQNLMKLLKNPNLTTLLNRVIDTVTNGKSTAKDISLSDGGMLHFRREGGLLKFLFTHTI